MGVYLTVPSPVHPSVAGRQCMGVPHLEEPERFNRELAALTRRAHA